MKTFSAKDRAQFLNNFKTEEFDLLIIGGGITGAGILLDAQSRGLKTALIEMQDFAAGTSSRSTKLIHGGLRYLKNLEFKLVAEVGRERAIVYENGPHVTKAEPMLLPIVKNGSMSKFAAGLGVWVYDHLAGVKKHEHRKLLSEKETMQAEPLLDKDKVTGGVLYYEYRTDDSRLTIEVLKKGISLGGTAVNYAKATEFIYTDGKVSGVKGKDLLTNEEFVIKAKKVVNATGPWVDKVIALDDVKKAGRLFVTKGVHLVVPFEKLPVKQSSYFDVGDGRMIFVIPREGKTYVGTTDTPYEGDFTNPAITYQDVEYLLNSVNRIFKSCHLKAEDFVSGWCGLRPLIREVGKSASEISRKDEIFINDSGLVSIGGGKLTGYRKMSEKIVDLISKQLKQEYDIKIDSCKTKHLTLSGGEVGGSKGFDEYVNSMIKTGLVKGLSKEDAEYIVKHYGSNSTNLFDIVEKNKEKVPSSGIPLRLYAQLIYALDYECILSPSDFFIRRTGFLYFYPEELKKWKEQVVNLMKERLNWTAEIEQNFRNDLKKQLVVTNGFLLIK